MKNRIPDENIRKFYDNKTEVYSDLIPKSSLCITCEKDELSGKENILCDLNGMDQQGNDEFICGAYEPNEEVVL